MPPQEVMAYLCCLRNQSSYMLAEKEELTLRVAVRINDVVSQAGLSKEGELAEA